MAFAIYPSLRDRHVFVSGGASGIGAALVKVFCEQGARVTFTDIDDTAAAALVTGLDVASHRPAYANCDMRDLPRLKSVVEGAGQIDVLINNAGRDTRTPLDTLQPDLWDDLIAVNLRHVVFASRYAAPGMAAAGGGSIINFGSPTFRRRRGAIVAYGSAKAGVEGATRLLARDLGEDNHSGQRNHARLDDDRKTEKPLA